MAVVSLEVSADEIDEFQEWLGLAYEDQASEMPELVKRNVASSRLVDLRALSDLILQGEESDRSQAVIYRGEAKYLLSACKGMLSGPMADLAQLEAAEPHDLKRAELALDPARRWLAECRRIEDVSLEHVPNVERSHSDLDLASAN